MFCEASNYLCWLVSAPTMPSADFFAFSLPGYPLGYPCSGVAQRPPGVSCYSFRLTSRIYSSFLRMTFGLPDSWLSYPERQALYPISVRLINLLPTAAFRFQVTLDTLAFGYKIPVISAPLGLGVAPAPLRLTACPAHQYFIRYAEFAVGDKVL